MCVCMEFALWRGYLSGARCRLAHGPGDATATHSPSLVSAPFWKMDKINEGDRITWADTENDH